MAKPNSDEIAKILISMTITAPIALIIIINLWKLAYLSLMW